MRIMEKTGMDLIFTEIAEGLPTTSYFSFCKNDGSEKCISFQPRLILLGIYVRFHRGVGAPRTWKKITLVGSWRMLPLMVHGFWRSLVEETVVYPIFVLHLFADVRWFTVDFCPSTTYDRMMGRTMRSVASVLQDETIDPESLGKIATFLRFVPWWGKPPPPPQQQHWVVATQTFFIFTPKIGEDEPILTNIFQRGWNHQLEQQQQQQQEEEEQQQFSPKNPVTKSKHLPFHTRILSMTS